ncbi:unnamed protein product [Calicophoron daubneyi]|uniref:Cell cycle control protein n=1 Tax=Calicophoron daubneyi TaxID=300641 RepID=A0AAV2T0J0_CALDB
MSSEQFETASTSRRPKDSPFFQQKLPAWQPMYTAKKSAVIFLIFGVIFAPLGAILLVSSNRLVEYSLDYTDCEKIGTTQSCADVVRLGATCHCNKSLYLQEDISGPVFIYYGLKNFYQNHRRYGRSKSNTQLLGTPMSPDSLSACEPYASYTNATSTYAILPCGAIANSIYNDSFSVVYLPSLNAGNITLHVSTKNVAWQSDVDRVFGSLGPDALKNTVKPPNWPKPIDQRTSNPFKSDEALMVWMRTAALPNFRKLYGQVVHQGTFKDGLPSGYYAFDISYNFPVAGFGGRKFLILGTVGWLGGKNITLGVTCLLTGFVHIALAVAFFILHVFSVRRKLPRRRLTSLLNKYG